jgi:hypothetical protein
LPIKNPDLPKAVPVVYSKTTILDSLVNLDSKPESVKRILAMELEFRKRVAAHIASLPATSSKFSSFNTSPFVLMFYAQSKGYSKVSEIVGDILPAKLFSSMETSAGRMMEEVALPIYGWQIVPSGMHTVNSAIDGKRLDGDVLKVVTLKSGPRCLNDEMSENFADNIHAHSPAWLAAATGARSLEFSYGVLYGTKKQSNKKDWHILGKLAKKLDPADLIASPSKSWCMSFKSGGLAASATVRVGDEWWEYLGGPSCLLEVCCALIRACVIPGVADPDGMAYQISDLSAIVTMPIKVAPINVAILQASQLPWLLFLLRHFCDQLIE